MWRIYLNTRKFKYICHKYLFGNSFKIDFFYTNIFRHLFVSFSWYKYIRIFIRFRITLWHSVTNIQTFLSFFIRIFIRMIFVSFYFIPIYSHIHSCRIFGYSFISKSIQMSLSGSLALTSLDVLLVFSTQFSNGLARQYLSICKVLQCPSLQIWSHQQRVQRRLRWCSS